MTLEDDAAANDERDRLIAEARSALRPTDRDVLVKCLSLLEHANGALAGRLVALIADHFAAGPAPVTRYYAVSAWARWMGRGIVDPGGVATGVITLQHELEGDDVIGICNKLAEGIRGRGGPQDSAGRPIVGASLEVSFMAATPIAKPPTASGAKGAKAPAPTPAPTPTPGPRAVPAPHDADAVDDGVDEEH